MDPKLKEYLDSGDYLPESFRDFHDQKNLFKRLQRLVDNRKDGYTDSISWVGAQVYVIDVFLWFMAKHGYTLQKSRKKVSFEHLDTELANFEHEQQKIKAEVLRSMIESHYKK